MTMVGVVIGTFGNREVWDPLVDRAWQSVRAQTRAADRFVHLHAETLMAARNGAALLCPVDRLIFLDADDELDPRYIEEMLKVEGDIIQPSTLGVVGDQVDEFPVLIPEKDLIDGNYIVIGAMVNARLFHQVGGFHQWSYAEDWELWIRMVLAGATIGKAPEAIYRVHVNPEGRNSQERSEVERVFNEIQGLHRDAWREHRRNL